ncbi:MAG: SiaB family protein kinase [Kiritimatiellae bacterium]|nr:SiaB family protein kinase [Kiritimatiellia bacterium]
MDTKRMHRVYTRSGHNRMLITFKTVVSQPLIERLAQTIKEQWGPKKLYAGRLQAVFVEMAQNVLHHSAEKADAGEGGTPCGVGTMEISEEEGRIKVQSGNLILRDESLRLAEQVDWWTSCEAEERKRRQDRQRKAPRHGPHAGLGLAELAVKTGGRFYVNFETVSDRYDFVVITAILETGADHE